MSKMPAFQFYPGDWRKDPGVQSLDFESRGVWFEILCLMHESDRRGVLLLAGKSMPEDALARLLGIDEVLLKQILSKIEAYGVASREQETGALMSRRMVRDEHLRGVRAKAGHLGGKQRLLKQNLSKTEANDKQAPKQKSPPSSSSSSSSSSSDKEEEERSDFDSLGDDLEFEPAPAPPPKPRKKADPEVEISVSLNTPEFVTAWNEFIAHRKEIKKPMTPMAMKKQMAALETLGPSRAIAAINHSIRNGWQGIFEQDSAPPPVKTVQTPESKASDDRFKMPVTILPSGVKVGGW